MISFLLQRLCGMFILRVSAKKYKSHSTHKKGSGASSSALVGSAVRDLANVSPTISDENWGLNNTYKPYGIDTALEEYRNSETGLQKLCLAEELAPEDYEGKVPGKQGDLSNMPVLTTSGMGVDGSGGPESNDHPVTENQSSTKENAAAYISPTVAEYTILDMEAECIRQFGNTDDDDDWLQETGVSAPVTNNPNNPRDIYSHSSRYNIADAIQAIDNYEVTVTAVEEFRDTDYGEAYFGPLPPTPPPPATGSPAVTAQDIVSNSPIPTITINFAGFGPMPEGYWGFDKPRFVHKCRLEQISRGKRIPVIVERRYEE